MALTGGPHQRWLAVLCLHASWLLLSGLVKGLGVMLPTLTQQFTTDTWLIGWTISIISSVASLAGPLAGPLEIIFGTRAVITTSGFVVGAALVVASFCTSVAQLTVVLSLTAGPCLSFVNILSRAMTGHYFTSNYATANGIGTSGHSVGMIIMAPLTQLLLSTYGWRGALLILGGINAHLGVCGALLKSPPIQTETTENYAPLSPSEAEPRDGKSDADTDKKSRIRAFVDAISAQRKRFGFSLCLQAPFWISSLVFTCAYLVSSLWLIYFVASAQAKGFTAYDAVTFTTAGGVGNLVCKISVGLMVDRGLIKLRWALGMAIIIGSVALCVVPWLNSYWQMMAHAITFNGMNGGISSLSDVYTRELLGADRLVNAFSWIDLLAAISHFGFGFFPGWMYDQSGSYDLAFVIMGCVLAVSLASLLVEWALGRCEAPEV